MRATVGMRAEYLKSAGIGGKYEPEVGFESRLDGESSVAVLTVDLDPLVPGKRERRAVDNDPAAFIDLHIVPGGTARIYDANAQRKRCLGWIRRQMKAAW